MSHHILLIQRWWRTKQSRPKKYFNLTFFIFFHFVSALLQNSIYIFLSTINRTYHIVIFSDQRSRSYVSYFLNHPESDKKMGHGCLYICEWTCSYKSIFQSLFNGFTVFKDDNFDFIFTYSFGFQHQRCGKTSQSWIRYTSLRGRFKDIGEGLKMSEPWMNRTISFGPCNIVIVKFRSLFRLYEDCSIYAWKKLPNSIACEWFLIMIISGCNKSKRFNIWYNSIWYIILNRYKYIWWAIILL